MKKFQDIIDDAIFDAKELSEKKFFGPVVLGVILILVILFFVIMGKASGGAKKEQSASDFSSAAAAGFENYVTEMKKNGITVKLRISDIRQEDGDSTSLHYQSDYADKDIIADLIITNKSGRDIVFPDRYMGGPALAAMKDTSSKHGDDDCICLGTLYDKASGQRAENSEMTIANKETKELTYVFNFPAAYINKINYLLFCSEWEDGCGEKWEIAGVGKPFLTCNLDNTALFPAVTKGEDEPAETEQTDAYISPYGWETISASDRSMTAFNSSNSGYYELSLEIAAPKRSADRVSVSESGYSNAVDGPSIIGNIPEITYDGDIDRIRVCFTIDDSLKQNTNGKYAMFSDEFKGIKRFNVFMFMEDINMLMPVETFCDESTDTVWAETDCDGTYALIDMELWLEALGVSPSEYNK